jgi:uncharacterized protein (TIGR03086 family)
MSDIDLEPATQEIVRLLVGVRDDQLANPTPCPDYPVAALLDHLMGLSLAFTWAAQKITPPQTDAPRPGTSEAKHLDPQWREVLPQRLSGLAAAWQVPDAWRGEATVAGVTMPAPVTCTVALDEVVLHGWDLARASGQEYRCDPISAQIVLAFTSASATPDQAAMRAGLFGPVIDVKPDASGFERALGFAGRDPQWSPSAQA